MQEPAFLKHVKDLLLRSAAEDVLEGNWKEPTDLYSNGDLPTFPIEGLPPVLQAMAEGLAEELQIPVDLVAVIALAALSAALAGRVEVRMHGSHRERVTLYALGLAESCN